SAAASERRTGDPERARRTRPSRARRGIPPCAARRRRSRAALATGPLRAKRRERPAPPPPCGGGTQSPRPAPPRPRADGRCTSRSSVPCRRSSFIAPLDIRQEGKVADVPVERQQERCYSGGERRSRPPR